MNTHRESQIWRILARSFIALTLADGPEPSEVGMYFASMLGPRAGMSAGLINVGVEAQVRFASVPSFGSDISPQSVVWAIWAGPPSAGVAFVPTSDDE